MKRILGLWIAAVLLSACGTAPKDRFYVLGTQEASAPSAPAAYTVAIGPVSVPEVVDRPQLVLYQGNNRIEIMEHERWAEPLRAAIPSAVARELRAQLPDARVAVYPQAAVAEATCVVNIDVQRLESRRGDSALIEALWSVRCAEAPVQQARSLIRESVQGDDYEALVSAHGRALEKIGGEIAQTLRDRRIQQGRQ